MPPEDLLAHSKKQPFEPFRIRMVDGAAYEIRHSEVVLVGRRTITLGLARSGEQAVRPTGGGVIGNVLAQDAILLQAAQRKVARREQEPEGRIGR